MIQFRKLLCLAALALALPAFAAKESAPAKEAASKEAAKTHSVVIHVGKNDPEVMNKALNNAQNVIKYYNAKGEPVSVEIVANGSGLHMFREDTSPVKGRLLSASARMPQVAFSACNETKEAMEAAEGKEIKILPQAKMVPSGVVRVMELEEKGWSYVSP